METANSDKQLSVTILASSGSCEAFLRPAFAAVFGPIWVRFERDFAFLTAFRTGCLAHFLLRNGLFSTPFSFVSEQKVFLRLETWQE